MRRCMCVSVCSLCKHVCVLGFPISVVSAMKCSNKQKWIFANFCNFPWYALFFWCVSDLLYFAQCISTQRLHDCMYTLGRLWRKYTMKWQQKNVHCRTLTDLGGPHIECSLLFIKNMYFICNVWLCAYSHFRNIILQSKKLFIQKNRKRNISNTHYNKLNKCNDGSEDLSNHFFLVFLSMSHAFMSCAQFA